MTRAKRVNDSEPACAKPEHRFGIGRQSEQMT